MRGIRTMKSHLSQLLSWLHGVLCDVSEVSGSPLFLCVGELLPLLHVLWRQSKMLFFILYQAHFYLASLQPQSTLAELLPSVGHLHDHYYDNGQCCFGQSMGCWRPLWPGVILDTSKMSWFFSHFHHLGRDSVPRQDLNIKKNIWESISAFQTLLFA